MIGILKRSLEPGVQQLPLAQARRFFIDALAYSGPLAFQFVRRFLNQFRQQFVWEPPANESRDKLSG